VVAIVALLVLMPGARSRWTGVSVAVGAAFAVTLVTFVTATKLTTAANAILLQSTAPLYLLLLGPWLLAEPLQRSDLPLAALFALGLAILVGGGAPEQATAPEPDLGNMLGAVSGISWAAALAGLRWTAGNPRASGAALVAGNVIVVVACAGFALPVTEASARDWAVILYLGIVQVALAYVCLSAGMRRVSAFEASLLILLEPVLNPVFTWLVHGERMGGAAVAGGAIVIGATAARIWLDARRSPAPAVQAGTIP
jgi:drug/metabolite transporter (DMT)-like permease